MGTPANRMITESGSSGSGLVPTPANRMITVSGLSGSGHLPTTMKQFWQMTQNPLSSDPQGKLYEQVGRLFEEHHIEDVRKMDIFDAISKKIRHLEEIPSAFCEQMIWRNKEAIAKDPVMKELVREFIDTIFDSSSLCNGLAKCLRMEKIQHDILSQVLRKVAPGSPPLGEAQLNKVEEKLSDFVKNADRDPFEDLQKQFESLLRRFKNLHTELGKKIEELSGKRKASRVWSTVSGSLMAALTAAAAITCVVAVVVAPPTAGVIGTALGLWATSMGFLGEMILSARKERIEGATEKLAEKVRGHSEVTEFDLKGIKSSMESVNRFRDPVVKYVKEYIEAHGLLDLAHIAMQIGKLEEQLVPKFDNLAEQVDGCVTKLTEHIEDLKKPLL